MLVTAILMSYVCLNTDCSDQMINEIERIEGIHAETRCELMASDYNREAFLNADDEHYKCVFLYMPDMRETPTKASES